jgi:epoxyqueuosine reductase QueG
MRSSLLAKARAEAAAHGLNLFGLVDCARFDAGERVERRIGKHAGQCSTVVVLGSGGRALAQAYRRAVGDDRGEPPNANALQAYAAAGVARVADVLRAELPACGLVEFGGSCRVNQARLGEAAGFGIVSPVSGLLLHPQFGPWLRVRGALLLERTPFGAVADASLADVFHPCCGCPRPCLTACPAAVHDGFGHHDLERCGSHRHQGGCASGCGSRTACPLGNEHRDEDGDDVHRHTHELASVRRWSGLGVWRFVPAAFRGGPLRDH